MRFEKTGEVRCPKKGEIFGSEDYPIRAMEDFTVLDYPILRPVPDEPSEREQRLVGLLKEAEQLIWNRGTGTLPGENCPCHKCRKVCDLLARIREELKEKR